MPDPHTILTSWQPVSLPRREPMYGRTVMLEPLDAGLHAADLWDRVH